MQLAQRGHQIDGGWDVPLADDVDVVVGIRVWKESSSVEWQRLAAEGRTLIYDIDDDLFDIDPANVGPHSVVTAEVKARIAANLEVATAVTVSTEELAEVIRPYNPNVFVLENTVDESLLHWQRPQRDRVTIGWAGSACHDADWASARRPLAAFFAKTPTVDLHLVGGDYRALLNRPDARRTDFAAAGDYHRSIDFDIAVIPLSWHRFNQSKSDLKLIEFSALGIPTVAADYGPYSRIEHGRTGFLVNQDHEWSKYLRMLVNDPQLRAEVGERAREWAAGRTIQGNAHRWEETYAGVVAARVGGASYQWPELSAGLS
ncbi:Glycosyl transferases group 1 [Frankineae bacterium MT45]|nr:Glycosyl transferases group 1 [Frankineae bacterium MT45]